MRRIEFTPDAWTEFRDWCENEPRKLPKLSKLIEESRRTPYDGTGKPERLRNDLNGYVSRRVDRKHRLVYRVEDDVIAIVACRDHYQKGQESVGIAAADLFMDADLFRFDEIWAAAGSPFSVFAIAPARLRDASGARVMELKAT